MARPISQTRSYQTFTALRDRALERLHAQAQADISQTLSVFLQAVLGEVALAVSKHIQGELLPVYAQRQLDEGIFKASLRAVPALLSTYTHFLRQSWILAAASEAAAISRAIGENVGEGIGALAPKILTQTFTGESIQGRIQIALDRVRRDVIDAVQLGVLMDEGQQAILFRVRRALPRVRQFASAPRVLQKRRAIRESSAGLLGGGFRLSNRLGIPEREWDAIVSNALAANPTQPFRGPGTVFDPLKDEQGRILVKDLDEEGEPITEWYGWEIEQLLTQDFVHQVRQGQLEAAKKAGVRDMIWIAVIDDRTDDCCSKRDGLTTREIEGRLKTNWKNDDCRAIVPPAHFNCRCRLAPDAETEQPDDLDIGISAEEFTRWALSDAPAVRSRD